MNALIATASAVSGEDMSSIAHDRLKVLEEQGQAGRIEYLQLSSMVADWREARIRNK